MHITKINNIEIKNLEDYQEAIKPFYELKENQTIRTEIKVRQLKESIIGLYGTELINDLRINNIPSSKLKTGLDLRGGARAFIEIKGEYNENDVNDVISVLEERLNAYGLTDLRIYKIQTSGQEILIGIEIAGSTPEQLESLIEEQGFFEAKIANKTVFIGGDQDITHVARTGEQAIVYNCRDSQEESYCDFQFK
jgi:preprotein translocase subunit SecD